jgi:hypothetical protein
MALLMRVVHFRFDLYLESIWNYSPPYPLHFISRDYSPSSERQSEPDLD